MRLDCINAQAVGKSAGRLAWILSGREGRIDDCHGIGAVQASSRVVDWLHVFPLYWKLPPSRTASRTVGTLVSGRLACHFVLEQVTIVTLGYWVKLCGRFRARRPGLLRRKICAPSARIRARIWLVWTRRCVAPWAWILRERGGLCGDCSGGSSGLVRWGGLDAGLGREAIW